MHLSRQLCEFVTNHPVPCVCFDKDGVCCSMNVHASEFFSSMDAECRRMKDVEELFGADLKPSGKVLLHQGCVEYAVVPADSMSVLIFLFKSVSELEFPFGVFITDAEGFVIDCSPLCRKIFGHMPGTIKAFSSLKGKYSGTGMRLSSSDWGMAKALKGEITEEELLDIRKKSGETASISYSSYPIRDSCGTVIGSVSYVQDVCGYREAELSAVSSKRIAEDCLRNVIQMISSSADSSLKTAADCMYRIYQLESCVASAEIVDLSRLLNIVAHECSKCGRAVLCEAEEGCFISGNPDLKDALKLMISSISLSTIRISVKTCCEMEREYYRIEIGNRCAGSRHTDCSSLSDCTLKLASKIIKSLGGRSWAEGMTGYIILLPAAAYPYAVRTVSGESFAY